MAYGQSPDEVELKCVLKLNDGPKYDESTQTLHTFDTTDNEEPLIIKKNQNRYDLQPIFKDVDFREPHGFSAFFALSYFEDENYGNAPTISAGVYYVSRHAKRALFDGDEKVYQVENIYGGVEAVAPQFEVKIPADSPSLEFTSQKFVKADSDKSFAFDPGAYFIDFTCEVLSE